MPQGFCHSIKTFAQISLHVNSLWASPLRYYFIFTIFTLVGGGGVVGGAGKVIICYNHPHHHRDSHRGLLGSK